MANIVVKRGIESNRVGFTPLEGELVYTTDQKKLFIGDGSTAGGVNVSKTPSELLADIKTVDGAGSGLDADTLDGSHLADIIASGGSGGATGGGTDAVFVENDQVITTDYTIPVGKNAMTTGDISINNGITVTVSTGSNWVIL